MMLNLINAAFVDEAPNVTTTCSHIAIAIAFYGITAALMRMAYKTAKLKSFRRLLAPGDACDFYRDKIRITGRVCRRYMDDVWVEYTMFPLTGEKDTTVTKLHINQILRSWGR